MNLKDEFLKINNLDNFSDEDFIELMNNGGMDDIEIRKHYENLMKNFDYKKSEKELEEQIAHGFEVPWLLRRNK